MSGNMNHKLESRSQGETSTTSYNKMNTTLIAEGKEELRSLLMRVKERVKNPAYKSTFIKVRSWHLILSLHANRRGKPGSSDIFYILRLEKSLWTMNAAMQLKDTSSKNRDITLPSKIHIVKAKVFQ